MAAQGSGAHAANRATSLATEGIDIEAMRAHPRRYYQRVT